MWIESYRADLETLGDVRMLSIKCLHHSVELSFILPKQVPRIGLRLMTVALLCMLGNMSILRFSECCDNSLE